MGWNLTTGLKLQQTLMLVCMVNVHFDISLCLRAEYPFVKYNVQPTEYTYSQDEYTRFLEGIGFDMKVLLFRLSDAF